MKQLNSPTTAAYLSEREIQLCILLTLWVRDKAILASLPTVWEAEIGSGLYISTQFGHCPEGSGVTGWFRVTEEAFLYWETENEQWNHDKITEVNIAVMLPMSFNTLEALEKYIKTGEWK